MAQEKVVTWSIRLMLAAFAISTAMPTGAIAASFTAAAGTVSDTSPFPTSADDEIRISSTNLVVFGPGSAIAGRGTVGALANMSVHVIGASCLTCNFGMGASASFEVNDLIIVGPGTDPVLASFNLVTGGTASGLGSVSLVPTERVDVRSGANFVAFVSGGDGTEFGGWGAQIAARHFVSNETGVAEIKSVQIIVDGVTTFTCSDCTGVNLIHEGFTSQQFMVPVNTPLNFSMSALVSGSANVETFFAGSHDASGDAVSDFAHTISFPTSGPVFNLPPGFTAMSVDALIVNNQWTGGPAAVPEPGTVLLVVAGMLVLASRAIRRQRPM